MIALALHHPEIPGAASMRAWEPNEFECRRIEVALARRERYRYVTPSVHIVSGGYRIDSPCCSRNVDPDGGVVDVALVLCVPDEAAWYLYRRDHRARKWVEHARAPRLGELLELLVVDADRLFWQ